VSTALFLLCREGGKKGGNRKKNHQAYSPVRTGGEGGEEGGEKKKGGEKERCSSKFGLRMLFILEKSDQRGNGRGNEREGKGCYSIGAEPYHVRRREAEK